MIHDCHETCSKTKKFHKWIIKACYKVVSNCKILKNINVKHECLSQVFSYLIINLNKSQLEL